MPCVCACRRYPRAKVWLWADIEGKDRDVRDCINMVARRHGAQCASPPEVRAEAGWANKIPGGRRWVLRVGEVEGT